MNIQRILKENEELKKDMEDILKTDTSDEIKIQSAQTLVLFKIYKRLGEVLCS